MFKLRMELWGSGSWQSWQKEIGGRATKHSFCPSFDVIQLGIIVCKVINGEPSCLQKSGIWWQIVTGVHCDHYDGQCVHYDGLCSLLMNFRKCNKQSAFLRSLADQSDRTATRSEQFQEEDFNSGLFGSAGKERSYKCKSRLGSKYSHKVRPAQITRRTCSAAKWKSILHV